MCKCYGICFVCVCVSLSVCLFVPFITHFRNHFSTKNEAILCSSLHKDETIYSENTFSGVTALDIVYENANMLMSNDLTRQALAG